MLIKERRIGLQSSVLCQILNIPRDELGGILGPAGQEGSAMLGLCQSHRPFPGGWPPAASLGAGAVGDRAEDVNWGAAFFIF